MTVSGPCSVCILSAVELTVDWRNTGLLQDGREIIPALLFSESHWFHDLGIPVILPSSIYGSWTMLIEGLWELLASNKAEKPQKGPFCCAVGVCVFQRLAFGTFSRTQEFFDCMSFPVDGNYCRCSSRPSLIKRKRYQDLLVEQLWSKWKKQYIMDLRNAHALKNPNPQRNIAIDDVVLIEGDNKSKLLWRLGWVIQVSPGRDGGVRSCLLKTSDGTLKRPVQLLYPLEL
ncbi:hypothetical protein AVEN_250270-1 [Araneus ventricosus]|uniref:DUF5641 domain-containing protein n=1 Tax=Araneus ventricosus TaxID=182803 RepID=A0A4Y2SKH8_ARAVE|nr:hypothetical protein AVEN_170715-1 [Araneus ventricosus]GBN88097.1 hypothetical protein AVEN_4748-1 [Araneus ventricosus]GBN88116.1 hypothetical protein AVEN_250270-1 [Araneus ventricosus]